MKSANAKINDLITQVNTIKATKDKDLKATADTVKATETELENLKAELQNAIDNANADSVQKLAASIAAHEQILQAMKAKADRLKEKSYMTESEYKALRGSFISAFEDLEREQLAKIAAALPAMRKALDDYEALRSAASAAAYTARMDLYKDDNFNSRDFATRDMLARNDGTFASRSLPFNSVSNIEKLVK